MIGWMLGLLGVGGIAALVFIPGLAGAAFGVGQGLFRRLMEISVPLLVAGTVLLVWSGFLIWRWGVAAHDRDKARDQVEIVTGERDKARIDLALCNSNVDTLTASLESQNAAIDRLKAEGDERTRRANAAIRKAQEQARGYQRRIARLEAATPASGDLCVSARSLIVDTLAEDRQ
jgi:hypothetical protein